MIRKIGFACLWLGFVVYALGFSPPDTPDTLDLIVRLSTGEIEGINPAIVALFYLMGIWPIIYGCVLFFDGHHQKIPAYPFAIASYAVGAFAILPYLALRSPNPEFAPPKNWFLKLQDSRILGWGLTLATIAIAVYGISQGDWANFSQQWQNNRFIHVMSLDFCWLCLLFPALLKDDMQRRGLTQPWLFWGVSLIPLWSPLLYLSLRPPVPVTEPQAA
ncbi:MAG: DUF2834 domain-containing protein [Jaaginema sp. PMC 1079.18]|nr:DUF2834 domain-containing protein [Jaaginema sp. PMC 1080.18]MEC4852039.1 DUF2834 domain-containing protein [Jaaginema sp. PMC 1079.18]MEC4867595.1 DUF2834 domain-containing protein [Jaaginema sp. PMC 1078.18]